MAAIRSKVVRSHIDTFRNLFTGEARLLEIETFYRHDNQLNRWKSLATRSRTDKQVVCTSNLEFLCAVGMRRVLTK